jgi:hypothetical protein
MFDTVAQEAAAGGVEVDRATRVVRLHCPITWPDGVWCLDCRQRFPCRSYTWAVLVLVRAGWHEDQIGALDLRTGPWS